MTSRNPAASILAATELLLRDSLLPIGQFRKQKEKQVEHWGVWCALASKESIDCHEGLGHY